MNLQPWDLYHKGLHVDILCRPIKLGQTVLVRGYGSQNTDTFATVTRINRKRITVKTYESFTRYTYTTRTTDTKLYRYAPEMLIVPYEFIEAAELEKQQLPLNYPEFFI